MLKILLDANLSFRVAKHLPPDWAEVVHVSRTGLPQPAKDQEIWQWAKANGYLIITQDSDFHHFADVYGAPPKVVLLKVGNLSPAQIATILFSNAAAIAEFAQAEAYGVLEVYYR